MFNRLAIKLLRQETARLRADLREERKRNNELLDRFVHSRVPERLSATSTTKSTPTAPLPANDSFTAAMEDAERLANQLPVYVEPEEPLPSSV